MRRLLEAITESKSTASRAVLLLRKLMPAGPFLSRRNVAFAALRRLRRIGALSIPSLSALASGVLLAAMIYRDTAPDARSAALRPIQSVLAMLNARSPGERASGELVSSKPLANAGPSQRALGKIFAPPTDRALGKIFGPEGIGGPPSVGDFAPPFLPDTLAALPPQPLASTGPFGAAPAGPFGAAPFGPIGAAPVGGGGGVGPIVGGGPGTGGGGANLPVPAVPEPSTWLMMIIAFGLCGYMLRRQRRPRKVASSCSPAS